MTKPFSQACENNRQPILAVLRDVFRDTKTVLEIGSGTGQHGVYMAENLPHLYWQTSDMRVNHPGINLWIDDTTLTNIGRPLPLQIGKDTIPQNRFDSIFTANTAHIMQVDEVEMLMQQVAMTLPSQGVFCQYGPFLYKGSFSSQSNADFHESLLSRGFGGIKSIEQLSLWAGEKMHIEARHFLPANNELLVWRKR